MDTKTSNPTRSILTTVIIILVVLGAGLLIRSTANAPKDTDKSASLVDSLLTDGVDITENPADTTAPDVVMTKDSNGTLMYEKISITKPVAFDSWTVGGTFSVSWVGGVGETYIALVPTLPNGFTAVSAKEASAVGSWKVFENVRALDITVPATSAGNYNVVVYNEFDAVVSDSFSITQ